MRQWDAKWGKSLGVIKHKAGDWSMCLGISLIKQDDPNNSKFQRMMDKYKPYKLESPKESLSFLNDIESFQEKGEFLMKKKNGALQIQDMNSKMEYEYEWSRKDFNTLISLVRDDALVCSVESKIWASQYAIRTENQCVGTLNHTSNWKDRYFGKFMTKNKKRVDISIKCERGITYIFLGCPHDKGILIAKCVKKEMDKRKPFSGTQHVMTVASNVDNEMMMLLWLITMEKKIKSNCFC